MNCLVLAFGLIIILVLNAIASPSDGITCEEALTQLITCNPYFLGFGPALYVVKVYKMYRNKQHHYNTQVFVWMFRKCCKNIWNYTRQTKTASPTLQSWSSYSSWPQCRLHHIISLSLSLTHTHTLCMCKKGHNMYEL